MVYRGSLWARILAPAGEALETAGPGAWDPGRQKRDFMERIIASEREMKGFARELLSAAGGRRIMTFTGEIGAGKTTLIQALCRLLGVSEPVTSPTFSLVNEYHRVDPATGVEDSVFHLDLYRLENIEEALDIGIEEYLDGEAYCLIEWPELIEVLLPEDFVRIKIEITEDSRRKVIFL